MVKHTEIGDKSLINFIKTNHIIFGGNSKLKIYGNLNCKSGKRMKRDNRVFFFSKNDAIKYGYRPCGHCMRAEYLIWKNEIIR